jgi:hypothetical protein
MFSVSSVEEVEVKQRGSRDDKSKNDATNMSIGLFVFIITMVLLFGSAVLLYLCFYTVPIASTTSLYMGQRLYRINFEAVRDRARNSTKTKHRREFVNLMHLLEYPWNFSLTLANFGIIAWDLSLPVLRWFWQNFKDVIFVIIRTIFGPQTIQGLNNFVAIFAEMAQIFINALIDVLTAFTSSVGNTESFAGGDETYGSSKTKSGNPWTVVPNPYAVVNKFLVRLTLLLTKYASRYIILMRLAMFPLIGLVANIYFQYHALIFKAIMVALHLMSPDQPLGLLIGALANYACKLSKLLYGSCGTQRIVQRATCQAQALFAGSINVIYNVLEGLQFGSVSYSKVESCNVNNLEYSCSEPLCTGSFDTGLGLCNAQTCTYDAKQIVENLSDLDLPCSYWQNPQTVLICMEYTRDYSATNSTRIAAQPIETIAAELCIVMREYILKSCESDGIPFGFDPADVAYAVCESDLSESQNFQSTCACFYSTPLCEWPCCELWTHHFNAQMYLQLGSRPLWDLQQNFPQIVFCPLMFDSYYNSTYFTDYTYLHGACNWWERVLNPIYGSFPSALTLAEVVAPGFIADYQNNTCTRTVYQVGVCQQTNTSNDPSSAQLLFNRAYQDSAVLNELNKYVDYGLGATIVTNPTYTTDYAVLPYMFVEKSYCQYYVAANNMSNIRQRGSLWSIDSATSMGCDITVTMLFSFMNWITPTTNTQYQPDGLPLPTDLAGLDPHIEVFGATVPPPDCSESCQCETDVETQHRCVNSLNAQLNTDGTEVDDFTLQTEDTLAINQQTYGPAVHTASGPDPSSPYYEQQKYEYDELQEAQNFPRETNPLQWEEIPDETVPVNIAFIQPTQDPNNIYYDDPLYFPFQSPIGRTINSIETEEEEEEIKVEGKEWFDERTKFYQDAFANLRNLNNAFFNQFKESWIEITDMREPYEASRRREYIFSKKSAEMGKQKLIRLMEKLRDDMEDAEESDLSHDSPDYMPFTRELLGIPPTVNISMSNPEFVKAVLIGLGLPTNVSANTAEWPWELSISEEQLAAWNTEQAYISFETLMVDIIPKTGPKLYDLFASVVSGNGVPDYLLFSEDLFGAKGQSCAVSRPLACCDVGKSAYLCCIGIPGCMKDISQAFFAAYTTMNTIDKWVCPEFNSFWKEIWATTRLLCLAINWAVYDVMPPPIQFIMKYTVSKIAYPEDNYPENSVGCTYVYSEYLYLFILLIVVFFMIASSQLILEMLTYFNLQSDNSDRDTSIYELQLKMERVEKLLKLDANTNGMPASTAGKSLQNVK